MPRGAKWGEENPMWKGDEARKMTKRERAQRRYPLGPCERCGRAAVDRHHKDGDTGNNRRSNIAILCRRCHMLEDGRLQALAVLPRKTQPPKPCLNCSKESKPLRKGRCEACAGYLRRTGSERPGIAGDLRSERRSDPDQPCAQCGRPCNWGSKGSKGMCGSCYQILWRRGSRQDDLQRQT